ncbi:hypothetical protein [Timonella sp. A28]|uniref:[protein-PII] uridylyltransferase family protein n=1 Tax=Timonella sp. A28 TaxID=3442640 RepID=UPI003EC10F44
MSLVDPIRYREGGIDEATTREVRRIKARVESERLPRGVDPMRHLKLGRGAITDVEWLVQLWQMQYGGEHKELRTTETLAGLYAAQNLGLVDEEDCETLASAWVFASKLRDAIVLWTGRVGGAAADVLPSDRRDLNGIARVLHYPIGEAATLEEDYLRRARRSRNVMEKLFYGY